MMMKKPANVQAQGQAGFAAMSFRISTVLDKETEYRKTTLPACPLQQLVMLIMEDFIMRNIFKRNDNETYKKHIELLGFKAKDKITGFYGVIDSVCFDLYGCIQVSLKPTVDKDGKIPESFWFDVTRLEIEDHNRIVDMPDFYQGYVAEGKKGPANKPMCRA